jgi:replicative DNA helicase
VTERRVSEDFQALRDVLQPTLDEIEAIGAQGGVMTGVPTGFADLDALLNGLHPGQLIVVAGRPGLGKCLAGDAMITDAHTGRQVPIAEFVRRGLAGEPLAVRTLTDDWRFEPVAPSDFVSNGHRQVFRLTTRSGRAIRATPNHPFRMAAGWRPMAMLRPGDAIAVARAAVLTMEDLAKTDPVEWDVVASIEPDGIDEVFDLTVDDTHNFLANGIVVHNSTAALDFARHASVRHALASAIFSLEMSKVEIVMRVLSAEARVPLHVLRSGQLSDDDWTKLARRMGEINEAPLFIDDTPNLTLMEIRAKARRLRQRHELRLIVVDYLQLMTSPKRVESRQQEVSDLSRGLKLLAKEVDCPVIAVAQLNRGPEQRTDKRPQLSDLRESGCLTADTRVVRADTNREITLGELLASGAQDIPVWGLDERLRYVRSTLTHAFSSGRKEVFRLRLASGRQIEATANHPFLTFSGWTALGDLVPGARVAVPRRLPPPQQVAAWPDEEIVLMAHLIGDGSFVRNQPIRYANVDEENLTVVAEAARKRFGIAAVRDEYAAARVTSLRLPAPHHLTHRRRNPIAAWLDELGLFGKRSHEKFVPSPVFSLPDHQVALFLRHLWATDGSVTVTKNGRRGRIYYGSTSRSLLDGIAMLLLRFGVTARIHDVTPGPHRPQYTLDISGQDDQLRFLQQIGVHGARSAACARLLGVLDSLEGNTNVDTVPKEVWDRVRNVLVEHRMSHREFASAIGIQFCGSTLWKHAPSRRRLDRVAAVLESAELELYATNDVFWDRVDSIAPLGERDVYDATVLGIHNFVANGIAVHNSIEQDSDVVILLHRDDYYDKESPRAGEADFIVAKHRNGPTDTVTVAAQLHLSRFVDMAVG